VDPAVAGDFARTESRWIRAAHDEIRSYEVAGETSRATRFA
jgi:hypothetical protein